MTPVVNALSELLLERDAVTVPGLGTFLCDYESAKVNVVTNHFERPTATIRFNPQLREENDQLAALLAARDGISPEEARQEIMHFVADTFAALKEGNPVELAGIGTLYADEGAQPRFEPTASNFNAEAFGLSDFSPEPVFGGSQDDWKARVATQIKDQNTPMTVDEKAVHEDLGDEERFRRQQRRRWLPALLWSLLLIFSVFLILFFLDIIPIPIPSKPTPPTPVIAVSVPLPDSAMQAQLVSYYPAPVVEVQDTTSIQEPDVTEQDSIAAEPEPTVTKPEPTVTKPEPTVTEPEPDVTQPKPETTYSGTPIIAYENLLPYSLIAGCFSQEANAENYLAPIREQGRPDAFLMKKGAMYYVCYGQYATMEEAKAAFKEVKADPESKAWILTK